jgi:hypothetical protein
MFELIGEDDIDVNRAAMETLESESEWAPKEMEPPSMSQILIPDPAAAAIMIMPSMTTEV